MKTRLLFLLTAAAVLLGSCGNPYAADYDPDRHQYDLQEKSGRPEVEMVISKEEPFQYTVLSSDTIIEGKVIDIGYETNSAVDIYVTYYVQVRDVWYGKCKDLIEVRIEGKVGGGPAKPQINDEVILFLQGSFDIGVYMCSNYERSIFIINPPDDRLFSFSNMPDNAIFDGKSIGALKRAVKKELKELSHSSEYAYYKKLGEVADDYLADDHPLKYINWYEPEYDPNRYEYSTRKKEALSTPDPYFDTKVDFSAIPKEYLLRSIVAASDSILEGVVESDGETGILELPGSEDKASIPYTEFAVKVRRTWDGKFAVGTITLRMFGDLDQGVAKPKKGDELVLFLAYHDASSLMFEDDWFSLVTGTEQSMFAINPPDNTLYSFSDDEAMSSFDGERLAALYEAVEEASYSLKEVASQDQSTWDEDEYLCQIGWIGASLLND